MAVWLIMDSKLLVWELDSLESKEPKGDDGKAFTLLSELDFAALEGIQWKLSCEDFFLGIILTNITSLSKIDGLWYGFHAIPSLSSTHVSHRGMLEEAKTSGA